MSPSAKNKLKHHDTRYSDALLADAGLDLDNKGQPSLLSSSWRHI